MLLAATVLAAKKETDAAAAPSCSGSQFVSGGSAANGLITCYNNAGVGKYSKEFGELAKQKGSKAKRTLEIFHDILSSNRDAPKAACGCTRKGLRELPNCGQFADVRKSLHDSMPSCNWSV